MNEPLPAPVRAHLIGLQKICFQKIKNQNWALIGRSVSTPRMVILIFRKFCFQGPSYRVEKHLFSENQKSKFPFDWSECQHAAHGDFDISEILFSAKKSWGTFSEELYLFYSKFMRSAPPSVPNIQSQHWYLHLSRDTHENTRASTHSKIPRKMSNPPPDQQTAPRGTRNQHLGQLCAGETGTSLLPPRGQAPADSGRNRSTAISSGYDVFAAGQARAAAYRAAAGGGSGNEGHKDEEAGRTRSTRAMKSS